MSINTFADWKRRVDRKLVEKTGLGCDDLPDYWYYESWEKGITVTEAVREVLENAQNF